MINARPIQVLIADDNELVRICLRDALKKYPNIEVIGEVVDGDAAVAATLKRQPTVVVMDINMDKMDGITATRLIKTQHPQIVVIGLSVLDKEYQVYAMEKAGASAVINKETAVHELYPAIQRAVASILPIVILDENTASPESPKNDSLGASKQQEPPERTTE
jgi:DNA-binding NarL/FixJ family response regulator